MIYNIQALRALAAMLVICVHLDTVLAPAGVTAAQTLFGEGGVDLFFVISGFVMVHTSARRPVTARVFLTNRIIRVVPLYWLVTLAVFAVALAAPGLLQSTHATMADLVRSLLFVPFVKANGLVHPLFFLGWTLNFEMFFYAIFALALALALALAPGRLGVAVMLAAAALALLVAGGEMWPPHAVALRFYTDPILLEFGFGMLIGLSRGPRLRRGTAALLLAAGLLLLVSGGLTVIPYRPVYAGVPAVLVVVGALALEETGWWVRSPFVQLLGGASYALYLFHPFVTQAVARLSARAGSPGAAIVLALLAFVAACALAILIHLQVERRITAWLRRASGRAPSTVDPAEAREIAAAGQAGG